MGASRAVPDHPFEIIRGRERRAHFHAGETLRLVIHAATSAPVAAERASARTPHRGHHRLRAGGRHDSHLLVPSHPGPRDGPAPALKRDTPAPAGISCNALGWCGRCYQIPLTHPPLVPTAGRQVCVTVPLSSLMVKTSGTLVDAAVTTYPVVVPLAFARYTPGPVIGIDGVVGSYRRHGERRIDAPVFGSIYIGCVLRVVRDRRGGGIDRLVRQVEERGDCDHGQDGDDQSGDEQFDEREVAFARVTPEQIRTGALLRLGLRQVSAAPRVRVIW